MGRGVSLKALDLLESETLGPVCLTGTELFRIPKQYFLIGRMKNPVPYLSQDEQDEGEGEGEGEMGCQPLQFFQEARRRCRVACICSVDAFLLCFFLLSMQRNIWG